MTIQLTLYQDTARFFADVRDHLEAHEAENGLLLGMLSRLADSPPATAPFLARAHDGTETLGVAHLTFLNLIVSRGIHRVTEPLIDALLKGRWEVPGIVGTKDEVAPLAAAWAKASGHPPRHTVEQMLYALHAVDWPTDVPGRMRLMTEADVELVANWVWRFYHDALPFEPFSEAEALANASARPAQGMTYLWEVDGLPVAMAALARPSRRGITVNAVYTPPEHRRHGYASALVAHVSDEGLKRGKDFCVLYTDLANPTSNAIYQKIGYRRVTAATTVRFQ